MNKVSVGAKTILFPTPVLIVGTYDARGRPNLMNCAWGGICCSEPPCVNISLRKATYTYGSLLEREAFTVGIPSVDLLKQADYVGVSSGKEANKFETAGLTPVGSELVDAPYAAEFPMVLECKLIHHHEIGLHTIFIGEIKDIKAESSVLDEKGHLDVKRVNPFAFAPGMRGYYALGEKVGDAFKSGMELL